MRSPTLCAIALLCLTAVGPAVAAVVTFQGSILIVTDDDGTGVFTGTSAGDLFTASFSYSDIAGPPVGPPDPTEARYPLSGSSILASASASVTGSVIRLIIRNDEPLESGAADGINDLLVPDPPLVAGQPIDSWTLEGVGTVGGAPGTLVAYEFLLIGPDADLFDDLAFRPFPPSGPGLLQAFVIRQGPEDNLAFQAIGLITGVTAVPLPGVGWLLLSGIGLLAWRAGRRVGQLY